MLHSLIFGCSLVLQARMRNVFPEKDAKDLLHACDTFQPVYCNILLPGRLNISLKSTQITQTAPADGNREERSHVVLYWLPMTSRIEFEILLLTSIIIPKAHSALRLLLHLWFLAFSGENGQPPSHQAPLP